MIKVALQTGITQQIVYSCLNSILTTISDSLEKGESVTLKDFGTFYVKESKAVEYTKPSTNETIKIPAMKKAKFRIAPKVKVQLKKAGF